jgi:ribosome assembly protein YihI (activator of Der GTPase)
MEVDMPSKSAKQARTMAAAAHDPKFAKKVGIPVKVAKEFNKADKGTGKIQPRKK